MLRLLKSRYQKQSLLNILNFYKSTERRLVFDMQDLMDSSLTDLVSANVNDDISCYWPDKISKFYGRRDVVDTSEGEIHIIDDFGNNILYSESLGSLVETIEELKRLGSFYIEKSEL